MKSMSIKSSKYCFSFNSLFIIFGLPCSCYFYQMLEETFSFLFLVINSVTFNGNI